MKVETLVGDRFVPIVAKDTTRALGESGVLTLSFSEKPTQRELFGKALYWVLLKPAKPLLSNSAEWKPALRGAYLNAAWASATETMTRELVGSSEGAPNLTLKLARPPVLEGTLELRIKEPLGEEERDALLSQDKNSVLSTVEGLPGDWVLWKQVTDPADEPAEARVYALEESTGEIRFGDGQYGRIPPIQRDSIVAFTYQRTEPGAPDSTDVPANAIKERTQLGLVSPVPSVEAAFAADQAAGGAPPESTERVVRFGSARLRHRGRAVTAGDLEDLALQSSPNIAQARCIVRPNSVKLVVVVRGKNPTPGKAQIRELRRLLLASAPASLAAGQTLRIQGPDIRRLHLDLTLTVSDLEYAGEVARDAKRRITDMFDVATGGIERTGLQLGENPSDTDIAYVLSNVSRLEGIEDVSFVEIGDDGQTHTWPAALKPVELAVLSDDPVQIDFVVAEVVA